MHMRCVVIKSEYCDNVSMLLRQSTLHQIVILGEQAHPPPPPKKNRHLALKTIYKVHK